jgi:hypothetical protein
MKQSSDHMNSNKVAGTGVKSVKVKPSSATPPLGNGVSGSSQSEKRGPQGNGK